jgi:hypothetical protein
VVLLQRALRWRERQPPAVLVVHGALMALAVLRAPVGPKVQVAPVAPVAPKDQVVHGALMALAVLRAPVGPKVQVAPVAPVAPKDQVVHGALMALAVLRAPVGPKVQVALAVLRAQVALVALAVPRVQLV